MLLTFSWTAQAEIIKASDIQTIEEVLNKAEADTIIVFDVADVLLTSKDLILKAHYKQFKKELKNRIVSSAGPDEAKILYSIISKERKNGPVDPKMPLLISKLQSKGIKVLGLTSCYTGKLGNIESLEDWRLNELLNTGYDFKKSWPDTKEKTFKGLISTNKEALPPVFKQGIIFASRVPKGEVLKAFLDYANLKPRKIIFVDNRTKNIESVQNFANANGILFTGVEYSAVIEAKIEPLNIKRAEFQFETLIKEKKWLSDEEADNRMQ